MVYRHLKHLPRSSLYLAVIELLGNGTEHLVAIAGDENIIFDAYSTPTWQVDAGFDSYHHAWF